MCTKPAPTASILPDKPHTSSLPLPPCACSSLFPLAATHPSTHPPTSLPPFPINLPTPPPVLQRISYAKSKSDAVAKLDGTYKPDKERSKKNAAARGEAPCGVGAGKECVCGGGGGEGGRGAGRQGLGGTQDRGVMQHATGEVCCHDCREVEVSPSLRT
jgi:hypothetical protein